MKLIKPSEISGKIMTLIEESDKFVIIVSPYIKISKWYKLLKKLEKLKSRNIPTYFIIRESESNQISFQELEGLGMTYQAIPDLHCKLYLNEKQVIVSSMNLLNSSEINSLEIAYSTENDKEYQELIEFCERYLNIDFNNIGNNATEVDDSFDWRLYVSNTLTTEIGKPIRIQQDDNNYTINTGKNNYSCFISNEKQNHLRFSGILSGKEFDFLYSQSKNIPHIPGIKMEIIKGGKGYYDMIWGTYEIPLKSRDLDNLSNGEHMIVSEKIIDFVLEIDNFKLWATENLR